MTQVTGKVVNRSQNGSRGPTVRRSPRACPERELYNLRRKTPDCNFIPDNLIFVTDSIFFNVFLTMILTFLNIYFIFCFGCIGSSSWDAASLLQHAGSFCCGAQPLRCSMWASL